MLSFWRDLGSGISSSSSSPPLLFPSSLSVIMASPTVKYQMIALDLDGTLLNSKHELTDEMTAYLRKLHDRGIIVAIATGRYVRCRWRPCNMLLSVCYHL